MAPTVFILLCGTCVLKLKGKYIFINISLSLAKMKPV